MSYVRKRGAAPVLCNIPVLSRIPCRGNSWFSRRKTEVSFLFYHLL